MIKFWDDINKSVKEKINSFGIENFRSFQEVKDTMYVGDQYLEDEKKVLGNLVEQFNKYDDFGCLVHQFYHLYMFKKLSNIDPLNYKSIVEFGGGCGFMRKVFDILGWNGRYQIIDNQPFEDIQKYYLKDINGETIWSDQFSVDSDLFIGMWSISESDERDFSRFRCKDYFIAYQQDFYELNNNNISSYLFGNKNSCDFGIGNSKSKYLVSIG